MSATGKATKTEIIIDPAWDATIAELCGWLKRNKKKARTLKGQILIIQPRTPKRTRTGAIR